LGVSKPYTNIGDVSLNIEQFSVADDGVFGTDR
jgi:hypothetical protein